MSESQVSENVYETLPETLSFDLGTNRCTKKPQWKRYLKFRDNDGVIRTVMFTPINEDAEAGALYTYRAKKELFRSPDDMFAIYGVELLEKVALKPEAQPAQPIEVSTRCKVVGHINLQEERRTYRFHAEELWNGTIVMRSRQTLQSDCVLIREPDKNGPQPKDGSDWTVKSEEFDGEIKNKDHWVRFVKVFLDKEVVSPRRMRRLARQGRLPAQAMATSA